ncbi:DUF4157 domain-containing protein [Halogeometricum borinquense]|uniref:DUF4157 domain-containing protein n=1 Tax=Halogeometricum borinquense TaxID=60847 RepID=A0A6C0UEM7_9EURY|nr:DUF4157 domain-containing protein [Halogeometricum borinquense]
MDGLDTKIQRLAKKHGAGQVREWADEGMTVDTMGNPRDMRAFRQRQKERPAEVPKDIERRNAKSVQRSRGAHHEASKAGDANVPDSVRDVISSPGQQLDASIQRVMEDRMGDTLGDVRIHTGPQAAKACEDINARAFTVGNHIAFNHGEYDPSSAEGQHILAHELAHVRQQTGGAVSMLPQAGELEIDPDPCLEREAEETAQRVMQGGKIGVHRMEHSDVHVQRVPKDQNGNLRVTAGQIQLIQRLPKDESVDNRSASVEGVVKSIVGQTNLSESSAAVIVGEAISPEELESLKQNIISLTTTSKINNLPAKRQRQVARNVLGKDPLSLEGDNAAELPDDVKKDIERNKMAVFGYSPTEDGTVPDFGVDWTDPDHVVPAREKREKYLKKQEEKREELERRVGELQNQGYTLEEVAHKMVTERNVNRIMEYVYHGDKEAIMSAVQSSEEQSAEELWKAIEPHIEECNQEALEAVLNRNEKKYRRAAGPSATQLSKTKDWEEIIYGSTKTSRAVDILVGLKDI